MNLRKACEVRISQFFVSRGHLYRRDGPGRRDSGGQGALEGRHLHGLGRLGDCLRLYWALEVGDPLRYEA